MDARLTKIGNSVGIVLPKETRSKLNLEAGDKVYLTEVDGGIKISPYDPDFSSQMEAARKIMKKDRAILRELAK